MGLNLTVLSDRVSISSHIDGKEYVKLPDIFDFSARMVLYRRDTEEQKQKLPSLEEEFNSLLNQLEKEINSAEKEEDKKIQELVLNYLRLKTMDIIEKYKPQFDDLYKKAKEVK